MTDGAKSYGQSNKNKVSENSNTSIYQISMNVMRNSEFRFFDAGQGKAMAPARETLIYPVLHEHSTALSQRLPDILQYLLPIKRTDMCYMLQIFTRVWLAGNNDHKFSVLAAIVYACQARKEDCYVFAVRLRCDLLQILARQGKNILFPLVMYQ